MHHHHATPTTTDPSPTATTPPGAPTPDSARILAADLYALEWDADLYATPRSATTERYENRAHRLLATGRWAPTTPTATTTHEWRISGDPAGPSYAISPDHPEAEHWSRRVAALSPGRHVEHRTVTHGPTTTTPWHRADTPPTAQECP